MRFKVFLSLLTVMAFILIVSTLSPAHTAERRPVTGTVMFVIDGKLDGRISSMSGGNLVGTIVETKIPDAQTLVKKSIRSVAVEQLEIEMTLSSNVETFNWLTEVINGKASAKNITIFTCDQNFNIIQSKEYQGALPAEFSMSNPDATTRDIGKIYLSFTAETVKEGARTGKCPLDDVAKRKNWVTSNFRLDIPGLETTQVRSVSGLTIKFKNSEGSQPGDPRRPSRGISAIQFNNLTISLAGPSARAKAWEDWFNTFLVQGRSSDQEEKSGTLVLLSQDLKNELLRINLSNLGLFKFENNFNNGPTGAVSTMDAGVYTEKVDFDIK